MLLASDPNPDQNASQTRALTKWPGSGHDQSHGANATLLAWRPRSTCRCPKTFNISYLRTSGTVPPCGNDPINPVPIPDLDSFGLLPTGIFDCTLGEIEPMFTGNRHRRRLFRDFATCIEVEVRPRFNEPIFVNGSFVTFEEGPNDVDVALDLRNASIDTQTRGLRFKHFNGRRLASAYRVDFWVNLPGDEDFSLFFQRIKAKAAKFIGLDPSHRKGILRIS